MKFLVGVSTLPSAAIGVLVMAVVPSKLVATTNAFAPPVKSTSRKIHRPVATPLFAESNDDIMSGLLLSKDAKSQLFASFSALSLADQYDAVLTGLCAKIVDGTAGVTKDEADESTAPVSPQDALADPMNLLQEMNQKRIVASPRSMMALIDVSDENWRSTFSQKILIEPSRLTFPQLLFLLLLIILMIHHRRQQRPKMPAFLDKSCRSACVTVERLNLETYKQGFYPFPTLLNLPSC